MLVPRLKQADRPELFLLPTTVDGPDSTGDSMARTRLRLRRWETRRAWSGRALVALGFPMAYVLIMLATGTPAPLLAVRIVIGTWIVAVAAGAVCAEAVWRHRTRLELRKDLPSP